MKTFSGLVTGIFLGLLLAVAECAPANAADAPATFTNPLLASGADPAVFFHDGYYYVMVTGGSRVGLRRTKDVTDLKNAEYKTIWTPPPGKEYSRNLWAPEIINIDGRWYVYFTADDGRGEHHKLFVLENASKDPFQGEFTVKGRLKTDVNDNWAIDGSVFEHKGEYYIVWSGWPLRRVTAETACIYIARLKNPWTIGSERVMLSQPEFDWERHTRNPPEYRNPGPAYDVYVNEGPTVLKHDNRIFVVYSASGCWTPFYCLGLLTADADSNLLDPASWKKSPRPVFQQSAENSVYGPGHNGFFKSPDGKEDWIIYHATDRPEQGGGNRRSPRAQKFGWKADGTPDFGVPLPITRPLQKPSGTQ